jgi:hypothetical protein
LETPVYKYNNEYYLRIEKVSGWEELGITPPEGTPVIELSEENYYCFKPLLENYISSSLYHDRENNTYIKLNGKEYKIYIPDYNFTIK